MKYKNLFFDLDDTLWAFSQNAYDTFEEVYDKYRLDSISIRSLIFILFTKDGIRSCGLSTETDR